MKFLLNVLRVTASVVGACPIPIQGPHPFSITRAPALIMSSKSPFEAKFSKTCLEPGETVKLMLLLIFFPFSKLATIFRSLRDELVQLPIQTWSIGVPSRSFTGSTLSGLWGRAI